MQGLEVRLERVRDMIAAACQRAGRTGDDIRLVAVTKSVGPDAVPSLLDAGLSDFGENRWQHARDMLQQARATEATWHFIGHLQRNKVKYVAPAFTWIHSVDSLELATEINRHCQRLDKRMKCLVQVNVAGEATKSGVHPDEAIPLAVAMHEMAALDVRGFMTMAPQTDDERVLRSVFGGLRVLLERARTVLPPTFCELSMGMSDDFSVAVEEGATMIRLGRVLTGG